MSAMGTKAQPVSEDSTIELNEFLIKADRLNEFSYGSKVQNAESSLIKQYKKLFEKYVAGEQVPFWFHDDDVKKHTKQQLILIPTGSKKPMHVARSR